jgi:hypothetical protein
MSGADDADDGRRFGIALMRACGRGDHDLAAAILGEAASILPRVAGRLAGQCGGYLIETARARGAGGDDIGAYLDRQLLALTAACRADGDLADDDILDAIALIRAAVNADTDGGETILDHAALADVTACLGALAFDLFAIAALCTAGRPADSLDDDARDALDQQLAEELEGLASGG